MVGMVSDCGSVPMDCGAGAVTTLLVSFVLQLQFRLSIADLCGINGFANSGCCMVKEYIARGKIRICVEYRKEAIFGDFWKRSAAKIENIAHLLIFTINYEYSFLSIFYTNSYLSP